VAGRAPADYQDPAQFLPARLESWNRVGTRLIPKLRGLKGLEARAEFTCEVEGPEPGQVVAELEAALEELGLGRNFRIEQFPEPEPPSGDNGV
jgi:hypothetical protein